MATLAIFAIFGMAVSAIVAIFDARKRDHNINQHYFQSRAHVSIFSDQNLAETWPIAVLLDCI